MANARPTKVQMATKRNAVDLVRHGWSHPTRGIDIG
jgi:hypothetical protein